MNNIKPYIKEHKQRFLSELIELLKIPSISADSAYKNDVLKTADQIKMSLEKAGCDHVEICETDGYPIVYGEKIIDKNLPTVLVYGHYDVQPPDPLDLWHSPPFEPVIKETENHPQGAIFARGACDAKGQMNMHVKALEFMTSTNQPRCSATTRLSTFCPALFVARPHARRQTHQARQEVHKQRTTHTKQ